MRVFCCMARCVHVLLGQGLREVCVACAVGAAWEGRACAATQGAWVHRKRCLGAKGKGKV